MREPPPDECWLMHDTPLPNWDKRKKKYVLQMFTMDNSACCSVMLFAGDLTKNNDRSLLQRHALVFF